ncbi:hypothetical protein C8J57DRAFT_1060787 [Mycena rebaudengoi]|nr:hypothetical protein C8J57DRAFT_1060787 [Mycena rebaudengoi]
MFPEYLGNIHTPRHYSLATARRPYPLSDSYETCHNKTWKPTKRIANDDRTSPPAPSPVVVPLGVAGEGAREKSNRKQHICPTCSKAFARPSTLRSHANTHSGERPFICSYPSCRSAFNVKSNMRRHFRSHASANAKLDPRMRSSPHSSPASPDPHLPLRGLRRHPLLPSPAFSSDSSSYSPASSPSSFSPPSSPVWLLPVAGSPLLKTTKAA